jgi:cytochrome c553
MKKKLLALSLTLAFSNAPGILQAEGNISAGKEKAASCVSCHGDNGNSMVSTFPKLAQQHPSYLIKQLKAFKSGARQNPMMSSIAMGLTDEDMVDIAGYYADQQVSANELPVLDDEDEDQKPEATEGGKKGDGNEKIQTIIHQGSDLYRNGDLAREVSACIACHGPFGEGNKPAGYPLLKSQHADYLIKTLTDYKNDTRSNNPENIMHMIAKKMTDEEIKAVSYRISMMK